MLYFSSAFYVVQIRDAYEEAGLMTEERALTLHATVFNTRHRSGQHARRLWFDANAMLRHVGDLRLDRVLASEMHISELAERDQATGYYQSLGSIPLTKQQHI